MTSLDHIWINANPEYREQIRRANEARAATYYAAWRAVVGFLGNGLRRLGAAVARARRAARTRRELSELSDRQLRDIGLWRSEIPFVSRAVASAEAHGDVTLADLDRIRAVPVHGGEAPEARRPADARRGRPTPWLARRPKARGERRAG